MARGSKRLRRFIADMDLEVVSLDESTRTSQMAADALGCTVAQIAKSIVFTGDAPVVVVISGDKRVDLRKLSEYLGFVVRIADAAAVRRSTGYVIGGGSAFRPRRGREGDSGRVTAEVRRRLDCRRDPPLGDEDKARRYSRCGGGRLRRRG